LKKQGGQTQKQLLNELGEMRERIAQSEILEAKRKQTEKELSTSEVRYRRLFETAQDGILILEAENGQIIDANPFLTDLLGYPKHELLGRKLWEIGLLEDKFTSRKAFHELQDEGYIRYEDLPLATKDGRAIEVEFVSNVYNVDGSKVIQCNIRDITDRKRAEKALEQRAREFALLDRATKSLGKSGSLNTVLEVSLRCVLECLELHLGTLYLLDKTAGELVLSIHKGVSDEFATALDRIPLGISMTGKAAETGEVVAAKDAARNGRAANNHKLCFKSENIRGFVSVPLKSGDKIVGVISAGTHSPRDFSGADIRLLEILGGQIGVAIESAQLLGKMSWLSITDELTGLHNRRYFYEVLESEIHRSQRYGDRFCVVMMDIDGFKKFNDKFGHVFGDHILKTFAETLKSESRKSDVACRYGGDEFAIILPKTDAERAIKLADRARSVFVQTCEEQYDIADCQLNLSAGVAEFRETFEAADSLIFLADCALYDAKQRGGGKSIPVSDLRVLPHDDLGIATLEEVSALVTIVDARDSTTYGHSSRVAGMSEIIGKAVGMSEKELVQLHAAALLHDIGKLGTPDSILNKPGKPTEHEWEVLKRHARDGAKIVSRVKDLIVLVPMILHHHEWYDGTGYPGQLKGENIPLGSRIISIVDAYDTMTTPRPYRNLLSKKKALQELTRCSGTQFDPKLVKLFRRTINKIPAVE
jgi:diguanylate cyclase (GGDEF)-like protein/PAS domain S-box-containing protein/putative nucleotidyltransferase with HDIG domain